MPVNTNWGPGPANTNWGPGLVNTNWGPGPANTNWGPGPANTNREPGPRAKQWAGGQAKGRGPSKGLGAGKYKYPKISGFYCVDDCFIYISFRFPGNLLFLRIFQQTKTCSK